jgi:23S rRNA pseudouridine1911/1915/1917 synthase
MNLPIIFEDTDLIVIDKPAGITVNDSDTTGEQETVQSLVKDKIKLVENDDTEFSDRGGVVHRLDRETSGVILIARNRDSFKNLQAQFKERIVKKTYLALVHGVLIPENGEVDVPVGRLPWNRKRFGVLAGGRESKTLYETLEKQEYEKEFLSFLRLFPLTGRTHQIRVHMKYLNRPIFGDFLYGGRKVSKKDRKILERVFLHASTISFNHPTRGDSMNFEAPLPEELKNTLKMLKFSIGGDF